MTEREFQLNGWRLALYLTIALGMFIYALIMCMKNRDITYAIFAIPLLILMSKLS
jgi:hypothetical protein